MSKRSIYAGKSQLAAECFSRAGGPEKVLVVPMDLAKSEHVAACCRGTGDYLTKPFAVHNNREGVEYLLRRVEGVCRQRHIPPQNVIIGGEDPAEYALNFIYELQRTGHSFLYVNAGKAARLRNNSRAVSDSLALDGIAQALIQQRGRALRLSDELYCTLKAAARFRRGLVRSETALKNQIHRDVDILFPGFLQESRSGLVPFSAACLDLMERDFSCIKIKRMRLDTLAGRLHNRHVHHPQTTAAKLRALAAEALPPAPALIPYTARKLAARIRLLRTTREAIAVQNNEIARCLVQTPGFFATSIPGIGVVLAGHILAEYGPPESWPDADNMASYAGIVPRQKQTGGPSKPPRVGTLPMDANRILKDYLLQAAFHAGTTGNHRLQQHYQRICHRDGRARLSTAKLLLRILRVMAKTQMVYLPEEILRPGKNLPRHSVIDYYQAVTEALEQKWNAFDLSGIPDENNHLQKWKETVHDIAQFMARNP